MYRHILIPTDGSELAERAVTHGLSLAKIVGAKVTVVIAEKQVVSWSGAAEGFLRYTEHIKKHATSVLDRVANAAKQAGVPCDTIQVQDVQPYEGIIATVTRGCDLIVMASHGCGGLFSTVIEISRPTTFSFKSRKCVPSQGCTVACRNR